jgi:tetratricopeptide (TPR) repeat protein
VLPLGLADTPFTAQMLGQVRADNTRDLLLRLLERAAREAPLLVAFDDAQWLDAGSWLLVQLAAQRTPGLLVALAVRPFVDPPAPYQRLAYQADTLRLQLRGLDGPALRELLRQRLGGIEPPEPIWQLILARAQGNAFVGEELLHALRASGVITSVNGTVRLASGLTETEQILARLDLPDTVQGLITSRIDRLSAAQQLTLKVASVIGPTFALGTLAALHPVEQDEERLVEQLFALQQAGLLAIESFEPALVYAFKHAVGVEAAYNLMSFGQRRRLHRQLAELLEARRVPEADLRQIAHHWRRAEEPLRAMPYLARIGAEALRGGAYREAAASFQEALQILDRDPDSVGVDERARAAWERQLGEALHGMGRLIESREQLERAVARLGLPLPAAPRQVARGLAEELMRQAAWLLRPGRGRSAPGGAGLGEAARAYALLAQLAYYDGQAVPSTYAALRALNLAERAGVSPELAGAYAAAHLAVGFLPPLAAVYRQRAQAIARQLGHLPTEGWVAEAQGLHDLGHGRWRRAQAALAVALAVGDRLGDQRRRAEAIAARCLLLAQQGAFATALAGCEELQTLGLRTGDVQVQTWGLLGAAENLLGLGALAQAEPLLADAEALLAENLGGARAEEVWAYALMARVALYKELPTLARGLADAAAALLGPMPPATIYALGGVSALAEVYLGLLARDATRTTQERAALQRAAARACRVLAGFAVTFPIARPAAETWSGQALILAGCVGFGRRLLRRAAARAARLGMPYDEARARALLARVE